MFKVKKETLKKYADVLVKFALNSGKGIKPNEVVLLWVRESAKPMLEPLQQSILEAGGHYITYYVPEGTDRRNLMTPQFLKIANEKQINFFPKKVFKSLADEIDHQIEILSDENPHLFEKSDSKKLLKRSSAVKPWLEWRDNKEQQGKFTWTLALYGTKAMAREAGLSLQEYWGQIIKACFLNEKNPVKKWKKVFKTIEKTRQKLNSLKIKSLEVIGEKTNLFISLGKQRKWVAGSGRNIPSFEIFTSPDCRKTEGKVFFNQPLYVYGNKIENIELVFKNGKVAELKATKGERVLKEMIKQKNADMVGEFSLTDARLSPITKFMAHTLYDENMGGKYGNMHIALGLSYKDAYKGNQKKLEKKDFEKLGFNYSSVHTDIISTDKRKVFATLQNGKKILIYKNGKFTV